MVVLDPKKSDRDSEVEVQQLLSVWNALSLQRRIVVTGATVLMFAAVIALSRIATAPNMNLLYGGLDAAASGEIVAALDARGVQYEVRGGAIFVPASERDALRLTLAGEGLPANGTDGYELLDGLTGFGTTSQMFDAAYWRAKEGELARTIAAAPHVSAARVHIASSSANPFQRSVTPSASVSVTGASAALDSGQAQAIRYLVAAAVPGLAPADVAVIDSRGGLLTAEEDAMSGPSAEDRADALRERVLRLVEARVGIGNAVVEVSVDTITESEQIRERVFDPESRVVISSDTEETTEQSQDQGAAGVTVASNLPDGEAGGGDSSQSSESTTRERLNYEVSETTREVMRAPGAIRRLSVAVLVNGQVETQADGSQAFVPLPEEEQSALRELVASAVGFDEARGDSITIRSMPFEQPEGLGSAAEDPGLFAGLRLDPMTLIQLGVLALVALVLGLFVVRPVLTGAGVAALPAPGPEADDDDGIPTFAVAEALSGEVDDGDGFANLPMLSGGGDGSFDMASDTSEDPVERLRGLIDERRDEAVQILRSWLDTPEEVE
ncbi:flagellar basal-body MS-ring/collar protein FliF [Roseivivax sediminis]|uniref:Flagellar M-ring protein n=1 Tax=Roseivivax sediminis TaxID=936889 RepID=A0A1I1UEB0_9RHOB|nr:flagellar basal-body MS-ring/collar protein FliF [Roseivivax sediminis]SFD69161.1 flagellar M-ring protein FliF [Roseivivax sediminis]